MKLHIDKLGKVSITVEEDFWNELKAYDRLTIVGHSNGIAYISRCLVPRGISIDNRAYWIPMGVVNAPIQANDYSILDSENDLPLTEGTYEGPYLIGNYGYFWVGANGNVEGKPQYKKIQLAGTPGKSAYESYKEYMIQSGKVYLDESSWSAMFATIIDAGISSVQVINAFNSNSQIAASSANTVRVLKKNIELLFSNLADIAFKNGKSAISLDWEGEDSDEPITNYHSVNFYGNVTVRCNGIKINSGQTFAEGFITLTIEPQENSKINSITLNNQVIEIEPDEQGIVTIQFSLTSNVILNINSGPIVEPSDFTINLDDSIEHVSISALENHGDTLVARLTADEHYILPDTITCSMDGNEFELSNSLNIYGSYNNETGVITLNSSIITNNIVITDLDATEEVHYIINLADITNDVIVKIITNSDINGTHETDYYKDNIIKIYDAFTMEIHAERHVKFSQPPRVCVGETCTNSASTSANGEYGPYVYSLVDPIDTTFVTITADENYVTSKGGPYTIAINGIALQDYTVIGELLDYYEYDNVSFKITPKSPRYSLSVVSVLDANKEDVDYTFIDGTVVINHIMSDIAITFEEVQVGTVDIVIDSGNNDLYNDLGLSIQLNGSSINGSTSVNIRSNVILNIVPRTNGRLDYYKNISGTSRGTIVSANTGIYHIDSLHVYEALSVGQGRKDITKDVVDIDNNTINLTNVTTDITISVIKTSIWAHNAAYYNANSGYNLYGEEGHNAHSTLIPIPAGTTKVYAKNGGDVNLATTVGGRKMALCMLIDDGDESSYLQTRKQLVNTEQTISLESYPGAAYIAISSRVLDELTDGNGNTYTSGIKNAYIKFEGVNPDTNTPFKIWGIKGFDVKDIQYNFHDNS